MVRPQPYELRFGAGLVATDNGKVIGVIAGAGIQIDLPGPQVSEEEIATCIGLLDVLAVHPDHRRTGMGALLRDHLLEHFRNVDHRLVIANMAAGRADLVTIHTGWGWTVGNPGSGLAVAIGPDPLALAEAPSTRVRTPAIACSEASADQPPLVAIEERVEG